MARASTPPNLLFIFSDQQRWDTLGCYGQPLPVTPHLDALAAEGVRFEHAFTCQPVCGPARACLQTGKYATETGCTVNGIALPQEERTLAHWLSEASYEVGYLGKWHLASNQVGPDLADPPDDVTAPVPPERRGGYSDFWLAADVLEFTSHSYDGHLFDKQGNPWPFPEGRYRVDAMTDAAIDYLHSRRAERPFFLFISYIEPHFQNDHGHFEGPRGSKERFANFVPPPDLAHARGDWREEFPDYLGCCHSLDENVGRLRTALADRGQAENTVIVYTSDHGCHFRTRNSEYKRSCHDASLHIPLIVHGPGFRGGRTVRELVSLVDLPPTVLRAGGVTPPASMRGRPVQALVEGPATDWPQEVFAQISEDHCGRALRTARWKYSVRAPEGRADPLHRASPVYVEDCLYDLSRDPHEQENLVGRPALAGVRAELREKLLAHMCAIGDAVPEIQEAPTDSTD